MHVRENRLLCTSDISRKIVDRVVVLLPHIYKKNSRNHVIDCMQYSSIFSSLLEFGRASPKILMFEAPVTRSEPVLICGFFGLNAVSQIFFTHFKDFFCYEEINVER